MHYEFGLIARDIQNSVSPLVYQTLAIRLGHTAGYEIFNVPEADLARTVAHCRGTLRGFNVTMPYKQSILPHMDALDESAEACGSTNTVLVENGRLVAYNTDGWGTVKALCMEGFRFEGSRVVLLGAGGVAFSIAYNLSLQNVARVDVVNLIPEQTEALCKKFGPLFHPHPLSAESLRDCCRGANLFINASVVGQVGYDDFGELDFLQGLARGAYVYDVNYSNPAARLVPAAQNLGLAAFRGKTMTAAQAMRVFEIWTGITPGEADIRAVLEVLER